MLAVVTNAPVSLAAGLSHRWLTAGWLSRRNDLFIVITLESRPETSAANTVIMPAAWRDTAYKHTGPMTTHTHYTLYTNTHSHTHTHADIRYWRSQIQKIASWILKEASRREEFKCFKLVLKDPMKWKLEFGVFKSMFGSIFQCRAFQSFRFLF